MAALLESRPKQFLPEEARQAVLSTLFASRRFSVPPNALLDFIENPRNPLNLLAQSTPPNGGVE
jgi:hypothetical protein